MYKNVTDVTSIYCSYNKSLKLQVTENTDGWRIEGKTKIRCLSKVLDHHKLPEQLKCSLASILQVMEHQSSRNISSFGILTMVVRGYV